MALRPDSSGLQQTPSERYHDVPPEAYHSQYGHAPEVAPQESYAYALSSRDTLPLQQHQYQSQDQYSRYQYTEISGQAAPHRAELPNTLGLESATYAKDGPVHEISAKQDDTPGLYGTLPPRTYCGLKKRTLIIVTVLVIVVVVGAVVGAVAGVLSSRGKDPGSESNSGNGQSGAGTPNSTALKPGDSFRALAATSCGGGDDAPANVYLTYQDKDGGININSSPERLGGDWQEWENIVNGDQVKANTPLSVTCWTNDQIHIRITYVRALDSALTQARAECNLDDSGCQWTLDEASEDVKLPNAKQFGMNYQAVDGTVNDTLQLYTILDNRPALIGNDSSGLWLVPQQFTSDDAETSDDSPIAAAATDLESHAFWFNTDGGLRTNNAENADGSGTIAYLTDKTFTDEPQIESVPGSLTAFWDSSQSAFKIYWLEDEHPVELTEPWGDVNGAQASKTSDDAWMAPDAAVGPVAATYGNGTARLFYLVSGQIAEFVRHNGTWSKNDNLPSTSYT
ncbi:hypothetical protein EJ05DRAFT_267381 [Pseudovirgaria hyperparasitica]|uniref:Fucose-specific lectin n=1 Tax=Pseudovirgaria hyperparasitica TaxID=470096 RepID=A0A6A6VRF4_9PEZI|nr:uncharacterized protein EJ05DRAFT_267381 [Pseudovirgaria hyperparasitica]KAF2752735.1 hypothetical protein EJ05DRAFT_267381 [Pseudovirgaria hyperparasitica]